MVAMPVEEEDPVGGVVVVVEAEAGILLRWL